MKTFKIILFTFIIVSLTNSVSGQTSDLPSIPNRHKKCDLAVTKLKVNEKIRNG